MNYQVSQFEKVIRLHDTRVNIATSLRKKTHIAEQELKHFQDEIFYSQSELEDRLQELATSRSNLIDAVASTDRHIDREPALPVIQYDEAVAKHAKACESLHQAEQKAFTAEKTLRKIRQQLDNAEKLAEDSLALMEIWRKRINSALQTPEQRLTEALRKPEPAETQPQGALLTEVK